MIRLTAGLIEDILEFRLYGPANGFLYSIFLRTLGWMIKPQVALREPQAGVVPPDSDSALESSSSDEDEEQAGNDVSGFAEANITIDSQNNPVKSGRRQAKKPDFAVARATTGLHGDTHHLYIEIKNGSVGSGGCRAQMEDYFELIIKAIPPSMHHDVVVLLINGMTTLVWRVHRNTPWVDLFDTSTRMTTNGPEMIALLHSIANRT
jgi:hypothetical protein